MKLFTVLVTAVTALTAESEKNRPVSKVITLLKDMHAQLTKESEADEEIYDKLACWCKTNDAEKSKAIETAEERIELLTSAIEEHTATSARLTTEIASLESEIANNQMSLDKAIALRQKQLAEFTGEEKDMLEAIGALKSAIIVLSKHHNKNDESLIATRVQHLMTKHSVLLAQVLSPSDSKKGEAFSQLSSSSSALRGPAHLQAYAPQSGEIFGILGNMEDTFESNLADSQKEEQANQAAFLDLKAAKEAEIKAGQEQANKKTGELAETDEKNAQAKEDMEDTRNSLSADEQFLMNLKEKCKQTDQEWEARQKTRADEMTAVSEALSVLASDDAHDTFSSTFNFTQLSTQLSRRTDKVRRSRAAAVLALVATKHASPALSNLAVSVKLAAFTKVKKAIDDMVTALLREKMDEIKHRDWCINGLHENESQTEQKSRDRADLEQKIADLKSTIKTLTSDLDELRGEIKELQEQLKRGGEDREEQNAEFQQVVKSQRETQSLLQRALNSLNTFYAKKKAIALAQEPGGPPPPAGFKAYKNNAGGNSVISLITQIVNDAKAMETEAIRDEEDAQKGYEDFVKATNNSVERRQTSIITKSEARATAEGDKVYSSSQHENVVTELEQLANENKDMHTSCDFVLKNFDVRQAARDEEVEALREARAILSGKST